MKPVAILCAARNSVYKTLPGVEVYDVDRDARTFKGGMPVIAHPPCRLWSAFTSQQAKPEPGEMELGLFCARMVQQNGGILEQPAHSRLFEVAGLPIPGGTQEPLSWSAYVQQCWWGYPMRKGTWLYLRGIERSWVKFPYCQHEPGFDRRREQLMSKNQRAATCLEFAQWMLTAVRMCSNCTQNPPMGTALRELG